MREPEDILKKARNRYHGVWRDALLDGDSGSYTVPLDPPSASAITARAGEVSAWLVRWRTWVSQHPDVGLRTRTIRTKSGDQPIHTHLDIPDIRALAGLNSDTAAHWERARARWDELCRYQAGQAVRPWLIRIVDLERYGDLEPVDIPADDLDALGLRPLPREVSIVLADPGLRAAVSGLRQITAPVDELARLHIQPGAVLIVENKEPALASSHAQKQNRPRQGAQP